MSLAEKIGEKALDLLSNRKVAGVLIILLVLSIGALNIGSGNFEVESENKALRKFTMLQAQRAYDIFNKDYGNTDKIAGDKIKIHVYPDKKAYLEATDSQSWSRGKAVGFNNIYLIENPNIIFVLPHELSRIGLMKALPFTRNRGYLISMQEFFFHRGFRC